MNTIVVFSCHEKRDRCPARRLVAWTSDFSDVASSESLQAALHPYRDSSLEFLAGLRHKATAWGLTGIASAYENSPSASPTLMRMPASRSGLKLNSPASQQITMVEPNLN